MCCGELGSSEHMEVWPKYSAQSPGEGDQEVDKKHTSCSSVSPMSGHPIAEQLLITVLQRGGQQINGWIGTFKGMVYEIIEVAWEGNKRGSEVVRAQEPLLSKSVLLSQVFLAE